jgi:glutamyl-tRNA synthetase
MVNFLVLLGWAVSDSQVYFSREALIEAFSLEGIGRTNSVFNIHPNDPKFFTDPKLLNINAHYIRTMPLEELLPHVKDRLESAGLWHHSFEAEKKQWFAETIDLVRERFHVLTDFVDKAAAFFSDIYPIEEKALHQHLLSDPTASGWLVELADRIEALSPYDAPNLEKMLRDFLQQHRLKPGQLINAVRTAVTGHAVGPEFIQVLLCLGQISVAERLRKSVLLFHSERRTES